MSPSHSEEEELQTSVRFLLHVASCIFILAYVNIAMVALTSNVQGI